MSDHSKIEWTDSTWNPIRAGRYKGDASTTWTKGWHCEILSPGCEHCYAQTLNKRLGTGLPYLRSQRGKAAVFLDEDMLTQPLRWKAPRRIFVCSMSDLFGDWVTDEMLARIFAVMGACDDQAIGHQFQILTKRADRMRDYLASGAAYEAWNRGRLATEAWPPRNIWAGVSVEDQRRADERMDFLTATPAALRWVSYEPALGAVKFAPWLRMPQGPRWLVVGGESGPGARPFDIEWARSIIAQCKDAGVAVFMKQVGSWAGEFRSISGAAGKTWCNLTYKRRGGGDPSEWPENLRVREFPALEAVAERG